MAWSFGTSSRSQNTSRVKYPREHDRVDTQGLACQLGSVVDVSGGGMRLRTEGRPTVQRGDTCTLGVRSSRHQVSMKGQVVWCRRTGWKSYEIGVRWVDVTPIHVQLLLQLARYGFVNIEETRGDSIPGATANGSAKAPPASPEAPAVEDLYRILDVARTSTHDQIHAAFRSLARKYHPDVNKTEDAHKQFTDINKAYGVLRDPETRKKYDVLLAGGKLKAAQG